MDDLERLYEQRFTDLERFQKDMVWKVLCSSFLQRYVDRRDTVLDLACGFGEFINNIEAARKIALDANPSVAKLLAPGVEFHHGSADDLSALADRSIDVCFTSNFFEHLPSKTVMDGVLTEVLRVLVDGGTFIAIQPNIRYAADRYWDYYDHTLPLSHLSAKEGFEKNGYDVVELVPRFLPWSIKSRYPKHPALVRLYLHTRPAWRILGRQFLIVARKPRADGARLEQE